MSRELTLVFRRAGGVNLEYGDKVIWSSDDDPDFSDHFGQEMLDGDDDIIAVLDYLVDSNVLTDDEADIADIESEMDDEKETDEENF